MRCVAITGRTLLMDLQDSLGYIFQSSNSYTIMKIAHFPRIS